MVSAFPAGPYESNWEYAAENHLQWSFYLKSGIFVKLRLDFAGMDIDLFVKKRSFSAGTRTFEI
jgi:hypothetical protein